MDAKMSAALSMLQDQLRGVVLHDTRTWTTGFTCFYIGVIMLGLEILSVGVPAVFGFGGTALIPVKGKHLDVLEPLDRSFILVNKLLTCLFVTHLMQVVVAAPSITWRPEEATLLNTAGSLCMFYAVYDLFYMTFHRILHMPCLYAYIHKHHHRQKAPSRGNLDAINVHPFEFAVGEYLHLLPIYLVPCHAYAVVFFVLAGGVLASLNHTRLDISLPLGIYSVKWHDVHHRLPQSNYSQYTMLWDRAFGSYRDYSTVKGCE